MSVCEELLAALSLQAQKRGEKPHDAPETFFSNLFQLLSHCDELWAQGLSHSLPAHLLGALERRKRLSEENQSWDRWLNMQLSRPPTWLKIRKGLASESIAKELIHELKVGVVEERESALGIRTERSLQSTKAFLEGRFEIQDLASQVMVEKMQVQPGDLVWDACAGGGGKSIGIAAALKQRGQLFASDLRPWKLSALAMRAKRSGYSNIVTFPWQAPNEPDFGKPGKTNAYLGHFDRLLIDAPCSGSGTWRRSPDTKFRMGIKDLQVLQDLQLQMIAVAWPYLKPQGRLFYGTCSYFVEENEDLIARALATIPALVLVQQSLIGCPDEDCDTMFLAELKRI
jgi:16S rRNA (cytosine967-C5)-methyltransferase